MSYFKNITSFDNLKNQFKTLARKFHPDCGGNAETMKAINCEYDALFPIWKNKFNQSSENPTNETSASTRSEFYTSYGWKGDNFDRNRTLKDIALIVRTYVKEKYPTYKFSVRTSYASMCQELHVSIKEVPAEILKPYADFTQEDKTTAIRILHSNRWIGDSWSDAEFEEAVNLYCHSLKIYTEITKAIIKDIDDFVSSYNREDIDSSIDYFNVNFYYMGCKIYSDYKIKEKTARIPKRKDEITPVTVEMDLTYAIEESKHTVTGNKIWLVKIINKLSKKEFSFINQQLNNIGGYYSKFTQSFIFYHDPSE